MEEEKVYIGTKVIRAKRKSKHEFLREKGGNDFNPHSLEGDDEHGYQVTYEDGYTSWSPADVFERSYREVTESEKSLING